jgi:hypothetical protein
VLGSPGPSLLRAVGGGQRASSAAAQHEACIRLRGVNALQFQIASHSSTAISTFRTTPPPAVLAPGPLQFQGVAGTTVPPRPRLSGYVLGAEMPCSGPGCRHPKCIKHRFQ